MFKRIKSILGEQCWGIGLTQPITFDGANIKLTNIKWIKGIPRDRWYADPFIVKEDQNNIKILAEEYRFNDKIGTITELTINKKNNRIISIKDVLRLSTHLSFPLLFKDGSNTYLCPENYESGKWTAYKYDVDNGVVGSPIVLINKPLVDATCIKVGNKYYVFGTMYSNDFRNGARDLYIYVASNFDGPYELSQTIKFDHAIARGAGAIIQQHSKMIMPTQNCDNTYGKEVIFNNLYFQDGQFQLSEIARILPNKLSRYGLGIHTYNQNQNIAVVDGIRYRYGIIASIASIIYQFTVNVRNILFRRHTH